MKKAISRLVVAASILILAGVFTVADSKPAFAAADFRVGVKPGKASCNVGQSAGFTVSVSPRSGFNSDVSLSVSGVPTGATATFAPATFVPLKTDKTSALTVSTSISTPPGSYALVVTVTGGGITHTATANLVVKSSNKGYLVLSASPDTRSVTAGQATTFDLLVTGVNGYANPVNLSVSGLPSGASAAFTPNPVTPTAAGAASTLSITTAASTPAGTYPLTIMGVGGGNSVSQAAVNLTVLSLPPGTGLANTPWPRFQHDNCNTGLSTAIGATPTFTWQFQTGAGVFSSAAIGADGTVYIGSGDQKVYALSGATGAPIWEFQAAGYFSTSPALGANGLLYIQDSTDTVYALDAATGAMQWQYSADPKGGAPSSPAIGSDGTVYVGSANGLHAIDGGTGVIRWVFGAGADFMTYRSPAIGANGTLYAVGLTQGSKVFAIDPSTGGQIWESPLLDYVDQSAVIGVDGTIYVGSNGLSSSSTLYALDAANGAIKWTFGLGDSHRFKVAAASDGTVYVAAGMIGLPNGVLYAVDGGTGLMKWSYVSTESLDSLPALTSDGAIYVGSGEGPLYAIDAATGKKMWDFLLGGDVARSLAIGADGTIYVGSSDGKVNAIR
jgi:outer membrane protein assembly factor BamB